MGKASVFLYGCIVLSLIIHTDCFAAGSGQSAIDSGKTSVENSSPLFQKIVPRNIFLARADSNEKTQITTPDPITALLAKHQKERLEENKQLESYNRQLEDLKKKAGEEDLSFDDMLSIINKRKILLKQIEAAKKKNKSDKAFQDYIL